MDKKKKKNKDSFGFCSHHRKGHIDYYTHTFRVSIRGNDFYLCARCTGIYSAFLSFSFVGILFGYSFFQNRFDPYLSLLFSIIFVLPLLADWGTQKLKLRESRNSLRFITGFIFGIGFWFAQFTLEIYVFELLAMGIYSLIMYIITIIGKKRIPLKDDLNDDILDFDEK